MNYYHTAAGSLWLHKHAANIFVKAASISNCIYKVQPLSMIEITIVTKKDKNITCIAIVTKLEATA
jgi:glutamine amidotransferase PdxT